MAIVRGLVTAVSTKFDKYTVQVNDNWYGTKAEWATVKPNKGDIVEFDDGGAKYTKNMKIVTKGAGGEYGSAPPKGKYSSLGVELGHAANLAMQVVLRKEGPVDTKEFYQDFSKVTRRIKAVMDMLRDEYENPEVTDAKVETKDLDAVVVMRSAEIAASDIF